MIIKWFIINYNICLSQLWSMIPSLGIYVWLAYIWWAENQFFFRKESCSVVSHSLRPLWNSPDQNIGADSLSFQSPTPAARDSTWRGEWCWWETEAASQFSWTAYLFQAYDSLLYFCKSIRSEVWYFQVPLTQICCLHKSLLPLKRSSFLSDSLIYFFSCVLVNTL